MMGEKKEYEGIIEFLNKLEKTSKELIKEIRKNGDQNVSTRFYLEEFKRYEGELKSGEVIKGLLENKIFGVLRDTTDDEAEKENKYLELPKPVLADQVLKTVLKRQLLRIYAHQTNCQQICKLVSTVEQSVNSIEQFNTPQNHKIVLDIYTAVQNQLKELINIVQIIISAISKSLENLQSPSISFQKCNISPDSNRRSALTTIIQSLQKSDKKEPKPDYSIQRLSTKQTRTDKRLMTKFNIFQKPLVETTPVPTNTPCANCLLF